MEKNKTLSVVIVTHNNARIITKALNLLKKALLEFEKEYEVIVVDNASIDDTVPIIRKEKWIDLIESKVNKGYAWANNQGLKKAKGKYILLLNSDVLFNDPTVLQKMVDYLDQNSHVGVITCKVLLEDGKIDPACHRGFPTPWASLTYISGLEALFPFNRLFSEYHLWYKDLSTVHEIDSCSGAFYLMRSKIVKDVGYLDETFFMYGEDLDYSFRIKKKGWKIIYNPESSVIHKKYQSGLKSNDKETKKRTINAFYDAMIIFYNKHYKQKYSSFITLFIVSFITIIKKVKLLLV